MTDIHYKLSNYKIYIATIPPLNVYIAFLVREYGCGIEFFIDSCLSFAGRSCDPVLVCPLPPHLHPLHLVRGHLLLNAIDWLRVT